MNIVPVPGPVAEWDLLPWVSGIQGEGVWGGWWRTLTSPEMVTIW